MGGKKKAGNVISLIQHLTTQHVFTLCQFNYSSICMISEINLIFCEIVSWDVPKFGGDLPRVYAYHFLFLLQLQQWYVSYNSVWNQFISANSIITCHFTISPVFHIYLPVMCICYYKENSRKSFIMLHNIVTFFEKL